MISAALVSAGAGTSLQTCTIINTSLTCVYALFSRCACVRDAKILVQVWRLVPAQQTKSSRHEIFILFFVQQHDPVPRGSNAAGAQPGQCQPAPALGEQRIGLAHQNHRR